MLDIVHSLTSWLLPAGHCEHHHKVAVPYFGNKDYLLLEYWLVSCYMILLRL